MFLAFPELISCSLITFSDCTCCFTRFCSATGFASSQTFIIDGLSKPTTYTYKVLEDNINLRTLHGLSDQTRTKLYDCPSSTLNCRSKDYSKFYDYYGSFDYANQWVQAAVEGKRTTFQNGNADFAGYDEAPRAGK